MDRSLRQSEQELSKSAELEEFGTWRLSRRSNRKRDLVERKCPRREDNEALLN